MSEPTELWKLAALMFKVEIAYEFMGKAIADIKANFPEYEAEKLKMQKFEQGDS
jgi:hypothetical protein